MRLRSDMRKSFSGVRLLGVLIFGCVILAMPMSAMADSVLTLNAEAFHTIGPQSTSAPCIIAGTQCQNPAGFDFTNFVQSGNITSFDVNSPIYDVSDFPFPQFNVAIDVNTTREEGEVLDAFEVFLGTVASGTRIYHFEPPPDAIGHLSDNGNGFGDWTLRSIDLSSYNPSDMIQFRAVWHGASDGAESFFLVSTTAPPPGPTVPEPTSLLLLGTGLSGFALVAWRKRKS